VKTSVAIEAKALGGGGVDFPAALVVVVLTLRTMTKLTENHITAIEHECRQLRASTTFCKFLSGPTPEESVVEASSLTEISAYMGKVSWSESLPQESGRSDWQWNPSPAGDE
jgi:hypothetical protein